MAIYRAGGGRTHTVSPPADFKSIDFPHFLATLYVLILGEFWLNFLYLVGTRR